MQLNKLFGLGQSILPYYIRCRVFFAAGARSLLSSFFQSWHNWMPAHIKRIEVTFRMHSRDFSCTQRTAHGAHQQHITQNVGHCFIAPFGDGYGTVVPEYSLSRNYSIIIRTFNTMHNFHHTFFRCNLLRLDVDDDDVTMEFPANEFCFSFHSFELDSLLWDYNDGKKALRSSDRIHFVLWNVCGG